MYEKILIDAINNRTAIRCNYGDKSRLIEPHALGHNAAGRVMLRAYQAGGGSATKEEGWKMFDMAKMSNVELAPTPSQAPRPGYRMGDTALAYIVAQIDTVPA